MSAYCIWDVRAIHDQEAMSEYQERVPDTVAAHGGEYVVIGGPWQVVEGDWHPTFPVVIRFPSMEVANAWYESEAYRPLRELRRRATVGDAVFCDSSGVATHLGRVGGLAAVAAPLEQVGFDLYRDVHKGLRAGLGAVTLDAGAVDPADGEAVITLAERITRLLDLVDDHATHEDTHLGPLVERCRPELQALVAAEHVRLDDQATDLRALVAVVQQADTPQRATATHRLYLGLAEFGATFLAHLGTEELRLMPALAEAVGEDELLAVNAELVGAIGPAEMEAYLRLILPAENPDDRRRLLEGMRVDAPVDVVAGVLDLAAVVLDPAAHSRLLDDLGRLEPVA